ncbi:MAG: secretin N-terminal domain-containing protein, partial [Bacillota bacterium]|nr:secretin N-terminal domain-containing protein [Bacillota bacterium]
EGEKTYRVTRRPFTVEYRSAERTLTVRAQQAELDRLVLEITLATGLNLLVEKGAEAKVSITIVNMPLETALRALAESQGLRLVQREGYYTFSAGGLAAPGGFLSVEVKDGLLTLEAREADLNAVLNEVAAKGKLNLIADREAKGPLTGSLRELPLLTGLRAFLEANGFQLVERYGTYLVRRAPPNNSLSITVKEGGKLDLAVFGTDLAAVLRELAERTGVNMVTYNYVRSQVNDVRLRDVTLEEALDFLLKGTNFTYRKEGETYLIGDGATLRADSLDLIETRLIPLRYLAAETLPTLLPQSFPANSVRILKEQNAISVTGTPAFIARVERYLEKIDQPPQVDNEVLSLHHINAEDLPKLLPPNIDKNGILVLKDQNAVVVTGTERYRATVRSYLEQIDVPAQQILFDVLVVEYSEDTAAKFNLKLEYQEGPVSATLGTPDGNPLIASYTAGTTVLPPTFRADLNALIQDGKAKVLANPKISTLHGRPAQFSVLTKRRYWDPRFENQSTSGSTSGGGTSVTSGTTPSDTWPSGVIRSIDTGVKLDIKPWVTASGEITMEIQPEISDSTDTGTSGLPQTNERSARTTVRVRTGETVIIGGLIQTTTHQKVTKVPILGDLPLLGGLFRGHDSSQQRSEFVIYITPHLVTAATTPAELSNPMWTPGEEKRPGIPSFDQSGSGAAEEPAAKEAPPPPE